MKPFYRIVFSLMILGVCACERISDNDLRNFVDKKYFKKTEISSSDLNGLWRITVRYVDVKDGDYKLQADFGNSLPYPGGVVVHYSEFDDGVVNALYSHYSLYDYSNSKDGEVYYECICDNDVTSVKLSFDKKNRIGACESFNDTSGDFILLESNMSKVQFIVPIAENEGKLVELDYVVNEDLKIKLQNWPNRDVDVLDEMFKE